MLTKGYIEDDYPLIREIKSPIKKLRPLSPQCRVVQFSKPLTEKDFKNLAGFMRDYPEIPLRIYGHYNRNCDLEFLKYFEFLKGFQADAYTLEDIGGLRYLPSDLQFLAIGPTKKSLSPLSYLPDFPELKELYIEGQKKNFELIESLQKLETLTIRSVTLSDLSVLTPLKNLLSLAIKLSKTTDLRLLPELKKLRYLELWMVKGLADLGMLSELYALQYLFLQALRNVTELPSFQSLEKLRRVHIETMKGLTNMAPIAESPNLETFIAADMRHLKPEHFRPFENLKTLKQCSVGLGGLRKNAEVEKIIGLPRANRFEEFAYVS